MDSGRAHREARPIPSRIGHLAATFVLAMAGGMLACSPADLGAKEMAGMSEKSVSNPGRFGDLENSSYLPQTVQLGAREIWFAETPDREQMRDPLHCAVCGDSLYVSYGGLIAVFHRDTGQLLWRRPIVGNHASHVTASGIATLDHAGRYVLLGFDGEPRQSQVLPFVTRDTHLHLLLDGDDAAWHVYHKFPGPISSPDREYRPAYTEVVHWRPDRNEVLWCYRIDQPPRAVLCSRDHSRILIATRNRVSSIPLDVDSCEAVTLIECGEIACCSLDPRGDVLLVEIVEDRAELKLVTSDGKTPWILPLPAGELAEQPPASSPDGLIYLVVGNSLHQIQSGTIRWTYALPVSARSAFLTVLKDDSVLVSADRALIHVSPEGVETAMVIVASPQGMRPIVDERGCIYIGGKDGLRCLG